MESKEFQQLLDVLKDEYGIQTEAELDAAIALLPEVDISVFVQNIDRKNVRNAK